MALTKVAPAGIGSTPGDGYRIGSSFLHSTGVEITNINATGILTAVSLDISGGIDFDGHTELDNVSIAGVVTATSGIHVQDDSTFYGVTSGRNAFWDKSENSLELGDYTYLKFGADEDLTVWSNNTASAINNKTGELRILSGTNVRILKRSDAGLGFAAQVANFNIDGACDFYHNGTKRIETTNTGAIVTGILTATSFEGGLPITNGANNRVITATSSSALTGESSLTFDGTTLMNAGGTITAERGAIPSVEAKNSTTSSYARFYCSQTSGSGGYAAFQKLGTTSTAIGGANATQIWCTGDAPLVIGVNGGEKLRITSDGKIGINTTTPGNNMVYLNHNGTNSPVTALTIGGTGIVAGGGSGIFLKSSSNTSDNRFGTRIHTIREASNNGASSLVISNEKSDASALAEVLRITSAGHLKLPDSAEIRLGGAQTGDGDLNIYHNGSHSYISHEGAGDLYINTENNSSDIYITSQDNLHLKTNNNSQESVVCVGNGNVILHNAGTAKFNTDADGAVVTSQRLAINRNAGDPFLQFQTSGTSNAALYGGASTGFRVFTKPSSGSLTERLRVKNDGDIEVGGNLKTNNITGKNLVINGSFQVDQWNNGSELSITNNTLFSADRWTHNNDGFTYYKTQRKNDGPIQTIGTEYYMRATVTTAVTLSGSTSQCLENNLEGNTVRWLNLGTSQAKQCTLSCWVRSSLTGTFGGALVNSGYNRCHPFSYTISSANTWEYKTFTFSTTGFTTGSFQTGTGVGLRLVFSVGNGPNRQGSTDQWHNGVKFGPTGETNLVATNGATMDIASVQLEEGTQATRFEHRSYQEEFLLCCRYYYRLEGRFTAAGRGAGSSAYLASVSTPVPLRAEPTIGKGTNSAGESFNIRVYKYDGISDSTNTPTVGTRGWMAGNNHITMYQTGHSVVDDRVLNIYLGGGYIDFKSEL